MNDLQPIHCRFCKQSYFTTAATVAAQKCDLCGKTAGLVDPNKAVEEAREQFVERAKEHTRGTHVFAGIMGVFGSIFVCIWKAWDTGVLIGSPTRADWFSFSIWILLVFPIWLASLFLVIRHGPDPNAQPKSRTDYLRMSMEILGLGWLVKSKNRVNAGSTSKSVSDAPISPDPFQQFSEGRSAPDNKPSK